MTKALVPSGPEFPGNRLRDILFSQIQKKGDKAMGEARYDLVKGLVIGGAIGAVAGILFAPKSGKETREDIARKTEEVISRAKKEYLNAVEISRESYQEALTKMKELGGSIKEKILDREDMVCMEEAPAGKKGAQTKKGAASATTMQ
jgi:gas vesicle protein